MDRIYKESQHALSNWINEKMKEGYTIESVGAYSFDAKMQFALNSYTPYTERITMFWVVMVMPLSYNG